MIVSIFVCALVIVAFTMFDVWGYGVLVQGFNAALKTPAAFVTSAYRDMQITFQFTLYALLIALHLYGALAGFVACHWCFGCDYLYYVIRGEDYSSYTITWFATSLPSLVFRVIGKPFLGKYLTAIGVMGIVIGLAIAVVFA